MILRLFCPVCAHEIAAQRLPRASVEVPSPVARLADDGQYRVECGKGHVSTVTVDNVKFELLFEMGLHALVDGYPREAVSSFAAALERFHEFYWRVVATHLQIPADIAARAWKPLSRMSERQLGAFASAALMLTGEPARLLTNDDASFRNDVIHNGYVPSEAESVAFGDTVMRMIDADLADLRTRAGASLLPVYQALAPQAPAEDDAKDDSVRGAVNILTAIDVRHPPTGDDRRIGDVAAQLPRIRAERSEHGLEVMTNEEFAKRYPDRASQLEARNTDVSR